MKFVRACETVPASWVLPDAEHLYLWFIFPLEPIGYGLSDDVGRGRGVGRSLGVGIGRDMYLIVA